MILFNKIFFVVLFNLYSIINKNFKKRKGDFVMDLTWMNVLAMLIWTGVAAITIFVFMVIDSLFTRYKDIEELKKDNRAVAIRFWQKIGAQAIIMYSSIRASEDLWNALLFSAVSFLILLVLEAIVRAVFKWIFKVNLDLETANGNWSCGLIGGALHVFGALILVACL